MPPRPRPKTTAPLNTTTTQSFPPEPDAPTIRFAGPTGDYFFNLDQTRRFVLRDGMFFALRMTPTDKSEEALNKLVLNGEIEELTVDGMFDESLPAALVLCNTRPRKAPPTGHVSLDNLDLAALVAGTTPRARMNLR